METKTLSFVTSYYHEPLKISFHLDYIPPRNKIPYATFEKTFYGRGATLRTRKEILANPKNVQYFQENRDAYLNLCSLLKERNLHKSIIPTKKSEGSSWVSFRPAGLEAFSAEDEVTVLNGINTPDFSTADYEYLRNDLFTYDIEEQAVDTCEFYAYHQQKLFGLKTELVFVNNWDYRFLDGTNVIRMLDMFAEVRDITAQMFVSKKSVMSDKQFSEILVLLMLKRYNLIGGTVKAWVTYFVKGFTFYEVAYAFNNKFYEINNRPIPGSTLRNYIDAPMEWVEAILGASSSYNKV